jgi:RNA polymerase sigma-70 factor, ECF subfamily
VSDLEHPTDSELASSVAEGNVPAFRLLVQRHLQPLRSYLALRAPVPDLIDEVAHDALVFAFHRIGDFTDGSLQAWLRAIAHNLLRDRLKAHARETVRRERYSEHMRWQLALAGVEHPISDEADLLDTCLATLPDNLRHVIRLRYEQQLSSEEIATQTGRSAMAIRTLLLRVRHQLRQCIEQRRQVAHA